MATGLIALLDDITAIAKMAAASLDDVAAQTVKASTKAAGVVIDDAAVTPRYVVGLTPERELPIIARIAFGSLKNKLLFLLPGALLLGYFAPWAITPLLMVGGIYLCYEGAEKLYGALFPHAAHAHEEAVLGATSDPAALENEKVAGAIRTDFILSAEIMVISLKEVLDEPVVARGVILAIVGRLGASGGTGYFAGASDMSTLFDDLAAARPTALGLVPRVCEPIHQRFLAVEAETDTETARVELRVQALFGLAEAIELVLKEGHKDHIQLEHAATAGPLQAGLLTWVQHGTLLTKTGEW